MEEARQVDSSVDYPITISYPACLQLIFLTFSFTKQDFRLTSFPKASSRVSAGTNDGEAAATLLHALSMGGVAISIIVL